MEAMGVVPRTHDRTEAGVPKIMDTYMYWMPEEIGKIRDAAYAEKNDTTRLLRKEKGELRKNAGSGVKIIGDASVETNRDDLRRKAAEQYDEVGDRTFGDLEGSEKED
jgi:hypothetical protein